jgi:hypothetical protein
VFLKEVDPIIAAVRAMSHRTEVSEEVEEEPNVLTINITAITPAKKSHTHQGEGNDGE